MRAGQHGLAGNAGYVRAFTAYPQLLDQSHGPAGSRGTVSHPRARRAGPQHNYIKGWHLALVPAQPESNMPTDTHGCPLKTADQLQFFLFSTVGWERYERRRAISVRAFRTALALPSLLK